MKKLYILLMVGFLMASVTAITVGQIFTQSQLDNANVIVSLLSPSWETKTNGNLKIGDCRTDADVCTAYVTLGTTLQKVQEYDNETGEQIGETTYEVVNKTIPILFRTTKYYNIQSINGTQVAYDTLMADLMPRAIKQVKSEVARIESWKTQDILDKQIGMLEIVDGQTVNSVSE